MLNTHPWVLDVETQLRAAGLPRSYVARSTAELADHVEDLATARGHVATSHLGTADVVANRMIQTYRQQTIVGRHPVLCLLVAFPLVCLLVVPVYYCLMLGFPIELLLLVFEESTLDGFAISMPGLALLRMIRIGGAFLPFALMSTLSIRWSRQAGRGPWWQVASTAAVLILACHCGAFMEVTDNTPGPVDLNLNVEIGWHAFVQQPLVYSVLQFVPPVMALVVTFANEVWSQRGVLV